uniref:Large ribosomal subunit protein uL1c n=1 Tax=Kalanchoe fedtschenkoi TaxID=63787 RepID=A0A7N1A4W6_KALFE
MALLRLLRSQARRNHPMPSYSQSLPLHSLHFHRFLSSSDAADSPPPSTDPPPPKPSPLVNLQPVSYAVKPEADAPQPPAGRSPSPNDNPQDLRPSWTREDARYVKNAMPSVAPVAYPSRVAPLPEDKPVVDTAEGGKKEELDLERRKIDQNRNRAMRTFAFKAEEELERVPFPTLIKVEKKKKVKEVYDLDEAIKLVKANAKRNFEETVEAHARLGISQRRTDLSVNGTTTLPHGTGKVVKVAVFAQGSAADEAKGAGAHIVGAADLAEGILNGTVKIDDFDTCIATPQMIPHIQKLARVLGKHGLFPNAKRGTIVSDVAKAVEEARRGRISFRMDKTSNVHVGLGKVTYADDKLRENIGTFVNALLLAKPAGLKKTSKYAGYVNSFHLCSTMGPGFAVSIESLAKAADQISRLQVK